MAATVESLTVKYDSNVAQGAAADTRAMEVLEQRVTRATKSVDTLNKSLSGESLELAKTEAANRKAAQAIAAYDAALAKGTITVEAHGEAVRRVGIIREQDIARAKEQAAALDARFTQQTATTQKLTTATGSASMAVRQLGIQSIDVFQQLASGAPIMTTFIQQGGQITQVAAQGGVSFGQLARGVGSFIAQHAGIIAGTAAVAALGVAVYSVASRSSELEAQQRALGVAIAGVGRSAELSGSQLQGYVTELKRQGVAAGDAVAGIAALARNAGVPGAMIGRIAGLAPDAAAALGVGVPEMMSRLADAAKGTADAIEKLDDAFNLLTPAQAAAVRQMVDHGDKAKALGVVFDALGERTKGLHERSLSPMGAALERIGNAWDGWMDRVAKSDVVQKAVAVLARNISTIASVIEGAPAGQSADDANARLLQLQFGATRGRGDGLLRGPGEAARLNAQQSEIARLSGMVDYAGTGVPDFGTSASATGSLNITNRQQPTPIDIKALGRQAAADVAGTPEGQIATLATKLGQYREALAQVGARNSENAALFDSLTGGVKATTKAIDDLRKKGEEHRTGLQKYADTLAVQIKTQQDLADAYRQGPEAVVRLTAAQKAAEKAISEGLVPGTAKYRAEVEKTTESLVRLTEATGQTAIAKQVSELDRATDAQLAMMAAYDGTAESITKATNQQKAYTDALKAQLIPGTREFTDAVSTMSDAYNRSSAAAAAFDQAQRSVQSLMDALINTVDRLAQGLVDAFLSGSGAAVNFGNIARAALASLASEGLKQGIINPVLNSVLGGNRSTLGAGLDALGGGSGGIMGSLGNLSTGVGITDALGLTNIKSMFSGLGETLGITGNGGLLSGLNSIMATPLWSTGLGAVPLEGAYSAAQVAASGATTSLGGLLGGAGLGFGAGTLLNSLLGGKSTGGTIGSGVGSLAGAAIGSIIPGVGTILGGLLGGVLGGAGGGLIGPNAPNAYSSTGVSLSGGQLSLGATVSQLVDTTQEVANATAQMAQINSFLAQQGISISSLGSLGQIGQNTPGKAADPTKFADLASAFSQLRFTSDDALKAAQIADKSFGSITELAQALQDVAAKSAQTTDLLDNVIPTLTKANDNVGSVAQQMAALAQPYNQAFASIQAALAQSQTPEMTARLSQGATDIVAALDAAYGRAWDGIRKQIDASDQALAVRYAQASANASGDKGQMRDAALMAFDYQAQQARTAYADQLTGLFGDAYAQTADYAARLAALDRTTAQERLAVAKQYAEDVVAVDQSAARQQAAQSALGVITSLSDYSRSLTYGSDSPLSPMSQYEMAQRDFQAVAGAARAGDFNSISKLSGYADTFLRASRTVNGSGIAYANDFAAVQDTIKGVASQSVESIIASAMAANVAASEAIAQKQDTTNDLLTRVLAELQQANLRPAA